MENLPDCEICINMTLYLDYVEWDMDCEKYISDNDKNKRFNKIDLVNDMFTNEGKYFKGSLAEFEWLYKVEQDDKVKMVLKKCITKLQQ